MTDAAACSRTSSLRPVIYTLAPFVAKAFAIINPLPDSQPRVTVENQGAHIPVPPPVTRPTHPESDITVAILRSVMIRDCWIACRHSPFYSTANDYCVNDINPQSYSARLYPGAYGKWRFYVAKDCPHTYQDCNERSCSRDSIPIYRLTDAACASCQERNFCSDYSYYSTYAVEGRSS